MICKFEGCNTSAYFNHEGEKMGYFCSKHKKEGMRDVKHKTCLYENCRKQPNYNIKGEQKPIVLF